MDKFKLYLFAACAVVCIGMWLIGVSMALFDIFEIGVFAFLGLVFIMSLMMGFPLLFLANVLGISKLANK